MLFKKLITVIALFSFAVSSYAMELNAETKSLLTKSYNLKKIELEYILKGMGDKYKEYDADAQARIEQANLMLKSISIDLIILDKIGAKFKPWIDRFQKAYNASSYAGAIKIMDELVDKTIERTANKNSREVRVAALTIKGKLLALDGDLDKALSMFSIAMDIIPSEKILFFMPPVLNQVAIVHEWKDERATADDIYADTAGKLEEAKLTKTPIYITIMTNKGMNNFYLKTYAEAAKSFTKAKDAFMELVKVKKGLYTRLAFMESKSLAYAGDSSNAAKSILDFAYAVEQNGGINFKSVYDVDKLAKKIWEDSLMNFKQDGDKDALIQTRKDSGTACILFYDAEAGDRCPK